MYFREPKASENTAHEYNIQPYSTFTSVILCLLPTFFALLSFTNYHMRACIIWRHTKYKLVSVATTKSCQLPILCVRRYILLHRLVRLADSKNLQVTQGET